MKNERPKQGLTVQVRNNDVNGALRKFKRKVNEDGILQTFKEKEFYEKPSEKRKKAKAAGRARWKKTVARRKEEFGY